MEDIDYSDEEENAESGSSVNLGTVQQYLRLLQQHLLLDEL
jgi:hypothetical protein